MKLYGRIFNEGGMTASIRAMHVQTELMSIANENVMGFDKVGYQRKDPVVSSFSEYIGVHGVSTAVDDTVGRIAVSENPLDCVISKKGYFQYKTKDGVKITRDGRFRLDVEGHLLTNEGSKVLADNGTIIKFPFLPKDLKEIKVDTKGNVSIFNPESKTLDYVATLAVVTNEGVAVLEPDIKQNYNEYSNVSMATEFLNVAPVRRNFEGNRQLFIIQNNNLSRAIQELGKA